MRVASLPLPEGGPIVRSRPRPMERPFSDDLATNSQLQGSILRSHADEVIDLAPQFAHGAPGARVRAVSGRHVRRRRLFCLSLEA